MATEVKVPPVGESISSGILAAWHVKEGDFVERDQVLFELETDKITSEGLAEVSGKISLQVAEGDDVDIGQVVAIIDESADGSSKPKEPDAVEPEPTAEEEPIEEAPAPEIESELKPVSPAVRRIAAESGIDPSLIKGTGKGGRVTKGDMLQSAKAPESPTPDPVVADPSPAPSGERTTRKKMTGLRKKIADRLVQAQQQAAILTTFNEVDMTEVMRLRKLHQEKFVAKYGHKLGFMSFFVKAVVNALKEVPEVNAQIHGQEIVTNHYYDVGIAVGTEKGLVVPVVRDCDLKSYAEIEGDILGYAQKARGGKLSIDDLQGGVFTITNGGIYGSMLSTPILNSPQSGILGMHSIQERPMAIGGEVKIRPMMYLALSYDHRIVDGKEAVIFLVKVKEGIEDPTRLLFEI
ncbi:MAG: 2-oxoglutarate dehydrogenase complex dihydrolipoyllysine-residue succinyltransferase [Verrucomicrobia bacterium]|nr:2-oxoglutarate dehydrogenase complex dihydrolipoyllysine-residue succinyltransferase [Verrucomicrobiota bacterium]